MAKKVELTSENLIDGDEYRDDIFSFIVDWEARTAQVSINDVSIYHVEIPSEIIIDGTFFIVTSFGRCYFDYIEEVVLPSTIISIGDNAFWYCKSLECIIIPEGVLSIGGMSFYECSCLASVTIPKSVKVIGDSAFQNCERLSDVHLLGNDIKIGGSAFDGTRWLWGLLGKGESNPLMEKGLLYIGNIAYKSTNLCGKHVRLREGTRSVSTDAFKDSDLTNIYIPDSVKNIAPYAFEGCQKLIVAYSQTIFAYLNPQTKGEYRLPDGIEIVAGGAFRGCKELTSVILPESLKIIEETAFHRCSKLTSIIIPNSIRSIEKSAFSGCGRIESVALPNNITKIDDYLFAGCGSLDSVVIPDGVISIGDGSFSECTGLTSLTLPQSVTSIGESAFRNCQNLLSIDIPESVKYIGSKSFENCERIESIVIPGSVKHIESKTFSGCKNLVSLIIHDGVEEIANDAFENCAKLESVIIPKSVKYIGSGVFSGCDSLKNLVLSNRKTNISDFKILKLLNKLFYYRGLWYELDFDEHTAFIISCERETEKFKKLNWPESIDMIVPETIKAFNMSFTVIGVGGFGHFTSLHSIRLPNSIKKIRGYAFEGCINLENINIPNSIEHIGIGAFYGCNKLIKIELPVSLDRMVKICGGLRNFITTMSFMDPCTANKNGQYGTLHHTFYNDSSSFVIPNGYKIIEPKTFFRCMWLKEIIIPEGVTVIGSEAFYHSRITSLVIPDSVKTIGSDAFNCNDLTFITIGKSVEEIGDWAFCNCRSLSSLILPNSVMAIGEGAFWRCDNVTTVFIPNNVQKIGERAFSGSLINIRVSEWNKSYDSRNDCNAIIETSSNTLILGCKNTIIPNSVKTIEEWAFCDCQLINLTIPYGVTSIKENAFRNCVIDSLFIPSSVTSIEAGAFKDSQIEKIEVDTNNAVYDSRNHCNAIIETSTNTLHTGCRNTIIPDDIEAIGPYAFAGCIFKTKKVVLPDNLLVIDDYAFSESSGFSDLVIPSKVRYIGYKAFDGIILENVYSRIVNPEKCYKLSNSFNEIQSGENGDPWNKLDYDTCLYIPEGTHDLYRKCHWGIFDYIVEFDFEKWSVIPFKVIR